MITLLDAPLALEPGRVGHKAANLARLLGAGFPVPKGVCVSTAAFRTALAPYQAEIAAALSAGDVASPAGAAAAAEQIERALRHLVWPSVLDAPLNAAVAGLAGDDAPLVVRSSATVEDLVDTSFAGQYETVVGVRGAGALRAAILKCWRSFFTANGLAARAAAGGLSSDEAMAVLVQPLVAAERAGVCFTHDPTRAGEDLLLIDAAFGLGLGTVDGVAPSDVYRFRRETIGLVEQRIVEKGSCIGLGEGGPEPQAVPDERRRAACLNEDEARRIAEFALAAESEFGCPQDVEWAIAERRVWILQSRPITTLPSDLKPLAKIKLDDAAKGERWTLESNFPFAPQLPLEDELEAVWQQAMAEANLINGGERMPRRRNFAGWPYIVRVSTELKAGDRRARAEAGRRRGERLWREGVTPWAYKSPEVIAATEALKAFDTAAADDAGLADHVEDAYGVFLLHWRIHWGNEHGGFRRVFREAFDKVSGLKGEEADQAVRRLLDGEETYLTALVDQLYKLAQEALAAPAVVERLRRDPIPALEELAALPGSEAFMKGFAALLDEYGDRSGSGYGSSTSILLPTWREDPGLVVRVLRPYLDRHVVPPAEARAKSLAARAAELEALCAACSDAQAVADLRAAIPLARKGAADLENHNHHIDQMSYGQLRGALMAAGRRLTDRGSLTSAAEIFWLLRDEIGAALRAEPAQDLSELVAKRRAEYAERCKCRPLVVLGAPNPELAERETWGDDVNTDAAGEPGALKGVGASPGVVRGRARVVPMETFLPEVEPGAILVAQNAGPSWTPLFPTLGGLVLDYGSLGQHAAITVREYDVPAVMQTLDATRRIKDGDWLEIDGRTGVVKLLGEQAKAV
ncbi:MAG TPA: PEP/pyruvate-binding domain-containing protein [Limnochordia bacterium]|nr:PEP/pyruvate-binding domain-containing protein [Limnochordia bacterium]